MILIKHDKNKQMGFFNKTPYHIVGLQTDSGNFRLYRDQDLRFFTHLIEIKEFNVDAVKDFHFRLQFNYKLYWITYDTY